MTAYPPERERGLDWEREDYLLAANEQLHSWSLHCGERSIQHQVSYVPGDKDYMSAHHNSGDMIHTYVV